MKRLITFTITFVLSAVLVLANKVVNVGILISDGDLHKVLRESMEKELKDIFTGTGIELKVTDVKDVKTQGFMKAFNQLEQKKNLDAIFILAFDVPNNFKVTTESKFISFPLGVVPLEWKRKNLDYIYGEINYKEDMGYFKELKNMNEIAFVVPPSLLKKENSQILQRIVQQMEAEKVRVKTVPITSDSNRMRQELQGVQGVYIISSGQNIENVLRASYDMKLPSFLVDFSQKYNDQALLGYNFSKEIGKRTKAAALNYLAYLQNKPDEIISNIGTIQKDIFFNMRIANGIGVYPSILMLQQINVVEQAPKFMNYLGFRDAINTGLKNNPDLKSKYQDITTRNYDVKIANSKRLPQAEADMSYQKVDKDIANALQPENIINGRISLNQLIFSDPVNASVQIQKMNMQIAESKYSQGERDYIYDIAVAYLDVLQLNAQLQIQKSNYQLVKEFLNVAKIKYQVGSSGIQDVYRWESSLSESLSSIARIEGAVKAQEAYLNKLLNVSVENSYNYQSLQDLNNSFFVGKDLLENYLYGEKARRNLLEFLMAGAKLNSPELYQVQKGIEILQREYKTAQRERYLPQVQAFGEYDKNNIIREPWGKGGGGQIDQYWKVGVGAVLPIVKGGEIIYTMKQKDSQIKSVEYQKRDLENSIDQSVAQQFAVLLADYVQTYTTKIATENAKKNLDIVKSLYAQGAVVITDLIDARNNALTAELNEVIANYNLLGSAVGLEKVYGDYLILKSPQEQKELLNQLTSLMEK